MKTSFRCLAAAALVAAAAPHVADAKVTRLVIEQRELFDGGKVWSDAVGPYERLTGRAYLEVDPKDPLNAVITNIGKAPRNDRGMVEFDTPFIIYKPVDIGRSNQKIWYGINNRGGCGELPQRSFYQFQGADPNATGASSPCLFKSLADDNLLLREGYLIVDAGWHGDGPSKAEGRLYPRFPIARNTDGTEITGPARWTFQTPRPAHSLRIADNAGTAWRDQAKMDDKASASLVMREREGAPAVAIAADKWAFGTCPTGQASLVPSETDVCLFDGFQPNKLYELRYTAKNPIVMGLGYAVTRDLASFLRNEARDAAGNPNPLLSPDGSLKIRRAYSSGISSTAMYQRDFLYLGFNEDEQHRRVFDGVIAFSAGANRLLNNIQFAHPTVMSMQNVNHDLPFQGPYTFQVTRDPISGVEDGILKRPGTDPKVIQIDEEMSFWGWRASLNVVDGAGKAVPVHPNVRLYFQNGWGHSGAAGLLAPARPAGSCTYAQSPVGPRVLSRALVGILDRWVDRGVAPPPSNFPSIDDGSLVSLAEYREQFPKIPNLRVPAELNELDLLDFGPELGPNGGALTRLPPKVKGRYRIFVPKPTADGHGAGGVNTIWTRVPLGTNVGWNFAAHAPGQVLCNGSGSYIPFAKTKAERIARGDPRLSLEERYGDRKGFVAAVRKAADELVTERFLIREDADRFVAAAEASDILAN